MKPFNYLLAAGITLCLFAIGWVTLSKYHVSIKNHPTMEFSSCEAKIRVDSHSKSSFFDAKLTLLVLFFPENKGEIEFSGLITDGVRVYRSAKRSDFSLKKYKNHMGVTFLTKQISSADNTAEASSPMPDYFGFSGTKAIIQLTMIDQNKILVSGSGTPLFIMTCVK